MGQESRERSAGPDQLKALLLVLVVFGHTITENVGDSPTKWLVYGVHMPAFLFLSGYLTRSGSLRSRSYRALVVHYLKRMLLAWFVVSLVWGFTFGTFDTGRPLHSLAYLVITPQWHLWYVPVLFAMITLAWVAVRLPHPGRVLGAAAAVGLIGWGTPLYHQFVPHPPDGLGDHRYYAYLAWFVLGMAVGNGWLQVPRAAMRWGLVVVGGAAYVIGFQGHEWAALLGFAALNAGLLLGIPGLLGRLDRPLPKVGGLLAFAGRHSLWIYLLHPFVTMPVRELDWPAVLHRPLGVLVTLEVFLAVGVVYLYRDQAGSGAHGQVTALLSRSETRSRT